MHLSTQNDFYAAAGRRGKNPPDTSLGPDPAWPPPLTSGFGVVIEKEEGLARVNRDSLGEIHGARRSDLWRILREHQLLIEKNQALLLHRCDQLRHGERFARLRTRLRSAAPSWTAEPRAPGSGEHGAMPGLLARHTSLIGDLESLISRAQHGEHDESLLAEIERNHEEMAWMLMALIKEDENPLPPETA